MAYKFSAEKISNSFRGIPLWWLFVFLFVPIEFSMFNFFPILIMICLRVNPFQFILFRTLCDSFTHFFFQVVDVFRHYLIQCIFHTIALLLLGPLTMQMLVCVMLSQRSLNYFHLKKIFLLFCCSDGIIPTTLSSQSLIHFSVLFNLLLISSSVFFFL